MPGSRITIPGTTVMPSFTLWQCDECGALCSVDQVFRHEQWHNSLSLMINDTEARPVVIERPRDDLALRKEIDGLYILLGEDPPFNDPEPTRAV